MLREYLGKVYILGPVVYGANEFYQ